MLKVNDKVKPVGQANLTYGYVSKSWISTGEEGNFYNGKNMVIVYWPEIKSSGQWDSTTVEKI